MTNIEQIKTRFYNEFVYSKEMLRDDYMAEFKDFDIAQWEPTKRAARLSAVVKNYKTSEMLAFVLMIGQEVEIDMTPLVVKRLTNALFGRTGKQGKIVALFGESGRINRSLDARPECIERIANEYLPKAKLHWKKCLSEIEAIKREYRKAAIADSINRVVN